MRPYAASPLAPEAPAAPQYPATAPDGNGPPPLTAEAFTAMLTQAIATLTECFSATSPATAAASKTRPAMSELVASRAAYFCAQAALMQARAVEISLKALDRVTALQKIHFPKHYDERKRAERLYQALAQIDADTQARIDARVRVAAEAKYAKAKTDAEVSEIYHSSRKDYGAMLNGLSANTPTEPSSVNPRPSDSPIPNPVLEISNFKSATAAAPQPTTPKPHPNSSDPSAALLATLPEDPIRPMELVLSMSSGPLPPDPYPPIDSGVHPAFMAENSQVTDPPSPQFFVSNSGLTETPPGALA